MLYIHENIGIYVMSIILYLIINAIFVSCMGQRARDNFGIYYWISVFFTPIIACFRMVVDSLNERTFKKEMCGKNQDIYHEFYVDKIKGQYIKIKRDIDILEIPESELPDYLARDWKIIDNKKN